MTELPPMVPSAEERLGREPSMIKEGGRHLFLDSGVVRLQDAAYRDGQQSRQPEIDALRALLDEAERALDSLLTIDDLNSIRDLTVWGEKGAVRITDAQATLARIRGQMAEVR